MKKSPLYTGTGDRGTTSLVGGQRVAKASVRLDAYGTVDEFSATLGIVLSQPDCPADIRSYLRHIQNILFNVGAYLATDSPAEATARLLGLAQADIAECESRIDALDAATPPARAFVLPGGAPLCAYAHLARTVCRRAERMILRLDAEQKVDDLVLRYFNRLSDYLFILSRHFNHLAGVQELLWEP